MSRSAWVILFFAEQRGQKHGQHPKAVQPDVGTHSEVVTKTLWSKLEHLRAEIKAPMVWRVVASVDWKLEAKVSLGKARHWIC
jgi:hypothetical protein